MRLFFSCVPSVCATPVGVLFVLLRGSCSAPVPCPARGAQHSFVSRASGANSFLDGTLPRPFADTSSAMSLALASSSLALNVAPRSGPVKGGLPSPSPPSLQGRLRLYGLPVRRRRAPSRGRGTSNKWSIRCAQCSNRPLSSLSSGRGCKVVKDLPWVCLSHAHCRRMRGSCFLSPYCARG